MNMDSSASSSITAKNTFLNFGSRATECEQFIVLPRRHTLPAISLCSSMDVLDSSMDAPAAGGRRKRQHKRRNRSKSADELTTTEEAAVDENTCTTLLLRNTPTEYTSALLLETLLDGGFSGQFDFLYVPLNFSSRSSFGYAFVNFINHEAAHKAYCFFEGFADWKCSSECVGTVEWSKHQGLELHIERFRNSPVMHENVADKFKPILFVDGVRTPFPEPTEKVTPARCLKTAQA